ncbi:hypothetical protein ACFSQ7_04445 [Paenibacillus rhizoplanae]|uniref:Uncharacterized protein n=1 Tax=Paenibacillus rhizoplanae TaxID=1917181 RepID=A0ABW5F0K5_9BACL
MTAGFKATPPPTFHNLEHYVYICMVEDGISTVNRIESNKTTIARKCEEIETVWQPACRTIGGEVIESNGLVDFGEQKIKARNISVRRDSL